MLKFKKIIKRLMPSSYHTRWMWILALFLGVPSPAHAEFGVLTITLLATGAVLKIIRAVVAWILGFSANFLNQVFWITITRLPASMPGVIISWGVMRDIANSFFLLILLWIALSIILNFEQLGGRKLLIRVIAVAMLINFSLAMVTGLYAFTNAIAVTIASRMPQKPGDYIMNAGQLQSVFEKISQEGLADNQATYNATALESEMTTVMPIEEGAYQNIKDTMLASIGIESAQAWHTGTATCGLAVVGAFVSLGWLTPVAIGACALSAAGPLLAWALNVGDDAALLKETVWLGITIIFMLMATAVFLIGTIAIFTRFIMMALLSILAPLAFLCHIIPGGFAEKHWKSWIDNLFKYAFFAPIFYMFLYVAFFMLKQIDAASPVNDTGPLDFNRFVIIVLAFGFMLAGAKLARQTAGAVGDIAIGLGKTIGMFALGGAAVGLAGGAGAIMRQPKMKEWVQEGSKAVSQVPYVGAAMRPVMRKTAEMYAKDRKDVQDLAKQNEHLGPEAKADLLRSYRSVTHLNEKAASAMAKASLEDEKTAKLLTPAEKQRAIELAAKFDLHGDALKLNPNLARKGLVTDAVNDTDAMRRVIEKVRPDEAGKWSKDSITPEVAAEMWKQFTPSHIAQMQRNNPDALTKAMQYDATNAANSYLTPDSMRQMRADTYRYLNTNTPGVRPPPELKTYKPRELAREDAMRAAESTTDKISNFASQKQRLTDQISDLQNKAQRLQNIPGSDKQIRKIREVDVPGIQDKIARLDEDITNLRGTPI